MQAMNIPSKFRVTVLLGGPSSEREVSLKSGRAVADALRQAGHDVYESDIGPDDLAGLDHPCDVVFPVLHGAFGEDGQVQAILEARGVRYVGSDAASSRIAIDKVATKRAWLAAGIPTPAFHVATRSDRSLGPVRGMCVVKSIASGSSIGVFVCQGTDEAMKHMNDIVDADGQAMIEQFIAGTEITVGVLFDEPLPPIRIVYAQGFFDYQAKYSAGGAEHRFETGLSDALVGEIQQTVLKGHRVIGCRDLSRTDVMIDAEGRFYLIEINTLPGFTSRSLLPEAAAKAGVDFVTLVDRLVRHAASR
jgi:D-alanine-D-alanine ligase